MRNNRPLYWGQGQFLLPQHLQQQDLFHHYGRLGLFRAARPFGWGVDELALREDGLLAGELEVLRLRLITRDGVLIEAGSEVASPNARLAARNFRDLIDPAVKTPLSAYLALPGLRPDGANLSERTAADGEPPIRYRLARREVADLYDGEQEPGDVAFMDYNLELLFASEDRFAHVAQSHELIKLAELVPSPAGSGAVLVDDYLPPCLTLRQAPLRRWLQAVRDLLAGKVQSEDFAVTKRSRTRGGAGGQDLLRLIMLQTLNRHLPVLQHHLEAAVLHPFEAYALLRHMIGDLSTFSEEITVFGGMVGQEASGQLPAYDHEDLRACFQPALRALRLLIEDLVPGAALAIRLDFDGEYFAADVPRDFIDDAGRYFLMIESALGGQELVSLLQETGKISSRDNIPELRRRALFGLRIEHLTSPPPELPRRGEGCLYFRIDTHSPHWSAIRTAGDIAVFGRLDPKETAVRLLAVRPET